MAKVSTSAMSAPISGQMSSSFSGSISNSISSAISTPIAKTVAGPDLAIKKPIPSLEHNDESEPGVTQVGKAGFDHLTGSTGDDEIYSMGGNDYLSPGEGHDTIVLNGVDSVFGEGGLENDEFIIFPTSGLTSARAPFQGWADSGNALLGGDGADVYDFMSGALGYFGETTIVDFNVGGGDRALIPNFNNYFSSPLPGTGWLTEYDASSDTTTLQAIVGGGEIHFIGNTPSEVWSGTFWT